MELFFLPALNVKQMSVKFQTAEHSKWDETGVKLIQIQNVLWFATKEQLRFVHTLNH